MTHADKSNQSKYLALAAKLDWPTRIQGSSKQYDGELFGNLIRSGQHGKFTESNEQKEKAATWRHRRVIAVQTENLPCHIIV